jgi:hypothetical protein
VRGAPLRAWGLVALLVLGAGPRLAAQELDILELDDFLDPRELSQHLGPGDPHRLLASRVYVGAAERHNFRDEFLKSRVHFGRLASSLYVNRWQYSLKLTDYDTRTHREPPYFRSRAQVARYFAGKGPNQVIRTQVSWTFDESRSAGPSNEIAIDASGVVNLTGLKRQLSGGVVYGYDLTHDRHYVGASVQLPVVQWRYDSSIRIGAGVAQDRAALGDAFALAPNILKTAVMLSLGIPHTESRLYGAYSPAWRRDLHQWNHEVTVLLDATMLARLF